MSVSKRVLTVVVFVVLFLSLAACVALPPAQIQAEPTISGMPNPASVFCEQKGGKSVIKTAEDRSQSGLCVFPDGKQCDEWAMYRGQCPIGGVEAASAAAAQPSRDSTPAAIANPASQNCVQQGGRLQIETRGDDGQFGVCYFEDNRQCEEWALMRGECPVGGVKVTGYVTEAGRYCAITGGAYNIKPANSNTPKSPSTSVQEAGTCTFKSGGVCDVWDYYNGKCSPS